AWAAFNQGKKNDPELMLLVARAQSLSGRPGDALVMLERIAALGGATDAATSDDFARVRALPRWPEVAAKLESATELPAKEPALPAKPPASASAKASTSALRAPADKTADKPPAKAPALPAKPPAPPAKDP